MRFDSKNHPIRARLSGGIGNQLFQFSNSLRVAQDFESKIEIDISWFKYSYMKSNLVSSREYELDYFPSIREIPKFLARSKIFDREIGKIQRRLSGDVQLKLRHMTEKNVINFPVKPKYIDGVFADKKFLPDNKILENFLKFPEEESIWFKNNLNYSKGSFSVAVHVRMGDYLNLSDIYGVLDPAYYKTSMRSICEKFPQAKFFLFSDSPIKAQSWLGPEFRFEYVVDTPQSLQAGEILRYMSSFNGIICANSTFSWWAGYIGSKWNNMEIVILPKKFSNLEQGSVESILKIEGWKIF